MGSTYSLLREYFPPATTYSVDDIPDLTGKVMIVTGGNAGIGKETVKALLTHNAKVYMAARSREKAEEAIQDLKEQTGKVAIFLKLDLADLKSVKTAAMEFLSKETRLHVLFNNGGVMVPPVESVTSQGYDLTFGTNVLGHFYFTTLLLPTLLSTVKYSPDGKVRIVNTSSSGHLSAGDLDFNTFKDGPARRKQTAWSLYFQSKFANVVFSNELARRYGEVGVVSSALNPGNLRSDLTRHISTIKMAIYKYVLYPIPYGALTQLWAGTSVEGAGFNGKYLWPWARVGTADIRTQDEALGRQLWTWLEEQVKDL